MEPQKKKSLALTLIGHGVVLMILFLGAAFIRKPVIEYMEIDPGPGGPKNPGPLGKPSPPPARSEEPPEPPRSKPQPKEPPAPKPPDQDSEFATKKKKPPIKKTPPVAKKTPPAPKVEPKKTVAKTPVKNAVERSHKMVVRGSTAKPSSNPVAKGESAADIKRRMEEKIGHANGSADSTGPAGDGTGNASGTSNKFAAYLGGLQEQLQIAWEQPASAAAGLKTEVSFLLEKSGHLTGVKISKSSGNAEMDQSALLAAKSVGNYQPWPEDFTSDLAQIAVEFECKPNQ